MLPVVRTHLGNGERNLCTTQDVLDFAGISVSAALGLLGLAGGAVVFAGFGFSMAAALAVSSLKDMSSIL